MTVILSKTQIDRLGDRLRQGSLTETDLRSLDDYRRSFGEAYEIVVPAIQDQLQLEPTGRPAKSTSSLIEKLHRESIRLSQVQDIAGCRIVVADVAEQERVVVSLGALFPGASIVDRRANPTHGYRAVHVIVHISGKLIEIQLRSLLQHVWAELSEKLSDVVDPHIKYGGGDDEIRQMLTKVSEAVAKLEELELTFVDLQEREQQLDETRLHEQDRPELQRLRQEMVDIENRISDMKNTLADLLSQDDH